MDQQSSQPRLGVIGAGPVGLEAALEGAARGWDVKIFEAAEEIAASVRTWRHVPLFTPWDMIRGPRGEELCRAAGLELRPPDALLSGGELVDEYLSPLARTELVSGMLRTGHRVLGVTRSVHRKPEGTGTPDRERDPFLLHVLSSAGQEAHVAVDAVFDCSGVLGQPCGIGPGGGSAVGEAALRAAGERSGVLRRIPDLLGGDGQRFAGRRTLLLGAGHSAANAIVELAALAGSHPGTRVLWAWRGADPPYRPDREDPLPRRRELEERAAGLVAEPRDWLTLLPDHTVQALAVEGVGPAARLAGRVTLSGPAGPRTEGVDLLLALVGHRPDTSLYRELQVHTCYATEGPMALAARLLADGSADCLNQPETGEDALATTEPGFFVLGHKSYGRNPAFLLRDGYRQVLQAFELLGSAKGRRAAAEAKQ